VLYNKEIFAKYSVSIPKTFDTLIAAGMVSDFPDHYYPAGFDLSAILSQFVLNYVNKMPHEQNIKEILHLCGLSSRL
jgi:ABC-type glycerol-3-phosphate transport system substrate-binding protein